MSSTSIVKLPNSYPNWPVEAKIRFRDRLREEVERQESRGAGTGKRLPEAALPWREWLACRFPAVCTHPFAPRHERLWEWFEALEPGSKPRPRVEVWPRGGAKSSSGELGCVRVGIKLSRRFALYVCHETGSWVYTDDMLTWHEVDAHPTARRVRADGISVRVFGLPCPEVVTKEHRYWTRRVTRRDRGHGRSSVHTVTEPGWGYAEDLDTNTWIGYPIDRTLEEPQAIQVWYRGGFTHHVPDAFLDSEWWWFFGLWWGDGTLGGTGNRLISVCLGERETTTIERVRALWRKSGKRWSERHQPGMIVMTCTDSTLARWLATWKSPNGKRARKAPPSWVEHLEDRFLVALVQGYIAADGYKDNRSVEVTSIHMGGLLSLRRILMRLNIAGTIKQKRARGTCTLPGGRVCETQETFVLQFTRNADTLGYDIPDYKDRYAHPVCYVEGDWLWSRVRSIEEAPDREFVPITTPTGDYLTAFGRSHNCGTQDQADEHVKTVGSLFEQIGVERALNRYGSSKGWRRDQLRTANGFNVAAFGLDTAARGVKVESYRPDLILLDDVDARTDTPERVGKKVTAITQSLLPTGSTDCAVLVLQNMIHWGSIVAQLVDGRADFLHDREVPTVEPAVLDMKVGQVAQEDGTLRYRITAGEPTWAGQGLAVCEAQINEWGLRSFQREAQHRVEEEEGGLWTREQITATRLTRHPELIRIAVAIDPNATTGGDEAGVIGAGVAEVEGVLHGYVLEDATAAGGPKAWAEAAVTLYHKLQADVLVAEQNNGGEMVAITVGTVDGAPSVKLVHASRGKITRAEPVQKLYEDGRIHHVGHFGLLEQELCTYRSGMPSPGRMDALVWAMTELMLSGPEQIEITVI